MQGFITLANEKERAVRETYYPKIRAAARAALATHQLGGKPEGHQLPERRPTAPFGKTGSGSARR